MVFMPMRANRGDLEAYFKLAAEIGADSVILRPLIHLENPEIEADRGGYHFDYAKEMLSRAEMEEVAAEAERLAREYGILVQNQFNFGVLDVPGAKRAPAGGDA
jgi:MoaA/NifB/PqqE/SkfB family radical SAM enzyme